MTAKLLKVKSETVQEVYCPDCNEPMFITKLEFYDYDKVSVSGGCDKCGFELNNRAGVYLKNEV